MNTKILFYLFLIFFEKKVPVTQGNLVIDTCFYLFILLKTDFLHTVYLYYVLSYHNSSMIFSLLLTHPNPYPFFLSLIEIEMVKVLLSIK